MNALDRLLPAPRMLETEHVDLAAPPERVWVHVRHLNLGGSPLLRALFAIRTLPARLAGAAPAELSLRLDDLTSSPERPGFQILADDPPREVAVGAIGKVWHADIPFVHVADAGAYAAFCEPGFVKVAWALVVAPRGLTGTRVAFELRVDATDDASWEKFTRYFRLIGPGSHFIRRSLLAALEREFGRPDARENDFALPGDDLVPDAADQVTQGITIAARPEAIWPWLVQMGCGRAGFYAVDALDNGGVRSAREVRPELQRVAVGDVIPATPDGADGFEVLRVDAPHALILGGLYDAGAERPLAFAAPRPERFWQVTWAFVLEPLDDASTRLHVRARAAFPSTGAVHAAWIRPVHGLMQAAQLRHLAARAEGRLPRDDWRDALEGVGGAAVVALAGLTPFLRGDRNHWGLDAKDAALARAGDDLVPDARWGWTHAVEIDAPAEEVWGWVAQVGADRGGFYSYQALENLAGCEVRNAEAVHPDLGHREGDDLMLHPGIAPLRVVSVVPGRRLVAWMAPDASARALGRPWSAGSWLFEVEPLGAERCRFVSRYRCAFSDDLATRLSFGPTFLEPVGFAMDRRMLLGVKARAERSRRPGAAPTRA